MDKDCFASWIKTLDTGHYEGGEMFVALDWRWTVLYHRTPSFLSSLLLSVSLYLHLSRYLSWYLVIRSWLLLLMTEGASSAIIFAKYIIRVWNTYGDCTTYTVTSLILIWIGDTLRPKPTLVCMQIDTKTDKMVV